MLSTLDVHVGLFSYLNRTSLFDATRICSSHMGTPTKDWELNLIYLFLVFGIFGFLDIDVFAIKYSRKYSFLQDSSQPDISKG